jgi:endoglucanase
MSLVNAPVNTMKWLRTSGPAVITSSGEPVRLRGVGLGGWLNMENFITGYPSTESSHRKAMRRALGQRRQELLFDSLLRSFFGHLDAEFIASLGMNCVRIPVNYRLWEDDARPGEINPRGFAHLDRAIDACAAAGLYTVIDLHAAPGAQNHHWHSDNPFHQPLFWQHRSFQDRAVKLWEAIAARYAGRPEVAGYNVLNEPADDEGTRLVDFYRRAVAAIRAVDGRHMVFLDGNRYAREFPFFGEPFENAVYAVHQYPEPGAADGGPYPGVTAGHYVDRDAVAAEFAAMTSYMRERGLPVWVGEFGPVYGVGTAGSGTDGAGTAGSGTGRDAQRRRLLADQIEIYETAGAGWSVWTYKDIGVQGLVVVDPASPWLTRTESARAKKQEVAADHWGMTTDEMRDVLEPLMARFTREFPGFDPYPFGARRYLEQLVLSIGFAEPIADEFAACFAGASDDELVALGESFAFRNCVERRDLCEVVTVVPRGGHSAPGDSADPDGPSPRCPPVRA